MCLFVLSTESELSSDLGLFTFQRSDPFGDKFAFSLLIAICAAQVLHLLKEYLLAIESSIFQIEMNRNELDFPSNHFVAEFKSFVAII